MSFKIAIVDGDPNITLLLSRYLARAGADVFSCASGSEARDKLWTLPWDVALIERYLPDDDGVAICEAVKSTPSLMRRFVIVLSYNDAVDKIEARDRGADDYISKPVEFDELMARIRAGKRIAELLKIDSSPAPELQPYRRKIFISHAHEDSEVAGEIYDLLETGGLKPWLDKRDLHAGDEWRREIPRQIRASDAVIVCLSKSGVRKRGYVQDEFRLALEELRRLPPGQRFIIPVRIDDCEVPREFQEFHYLDYHDPAFARQIVRSLTFLG